MFLVIESVAFILWQVADGLTGHLCVFVHWLSLVCISVGPLQAIREVVKLDWRWRFWAAYASVWVLLAGISWAIWFPPKSPPKPHFLLSLQVGDNPESTVILTNEFLFASQLKRGNALPNGRFLFSGYAIGCIMIPTEPGQSNAVLKFTAESDSPVKVKDLQGFVAIPTFWPPLGDSEWKKIDLSLVIPRQLRLEITNLQAWAKQTPWVVSYGDRLSFPEITNAIELYSGPGSSAGFVAVGLRSTDFECDVLANLIFLEKSFPFVRPFVTQGTIDSNGFLTAPTMWP
jgi:hypothetical protein